MASPKNKSAPPLVFISHDSRDADFAEAFAHLLTDASGGMLQSFRSSDRKGTSGIAFGEEWYAEILSRLSDATDVVALLTARSLDRPWILYEVGFAKGKRDAAVLGLAINVSLEKANSGPFGQFHNCADDEDSLTKLVLQLIRRNPAASPRDEGVRHHVRGFLATLQTLVRKHATTPAKQEQDGMPKLQPLSDLSAIAASILTSLFEGVQQGSVERFQSELGIPTAEAEYYFDELRGRGLVTKIPAQRGGGGRVPSLLALPMREERRR